MHWYGSQGILCFPTHLKQQHKQFPKVLSHSTIPFLDGILEVFQEQMIFENVMRVIKDAILISWICWTSHRVMLSNCYAMDAHLMVVTSFFLGCRSCHILGGGTCALAGVHHLHLLVYPPIEVVHESRDLIATVTMPSS